MVNFSAEFVSFNVHARKRATFTAKDQHYTASEITYVYTTFIYGKQYSIYLYMRHIKHKCMHIG